MLDKGTADAKSPSIFGEGIRDSAFKLCLYSKVYRSTPVGFERLALASVHLRHSIVLILNDLPKVCVVGDYKGTWTGGHKPLGTQS